MADNMYIKLFKIREAIRREPIRSFAELVEVADKKAKQYKVIILFCYYDNMARLTLANMEDIKEVIKFEIPAELIELKSTREYLYKMAFNYEQVKATISPVDYVRLTERMTALNVEEKDILKRYNIKSLADMPIDIYRKCMTALDNMEKKQQ